MLLLVHPPEKVSSSTETGSDDVGNVAHITHSQIAVPSLLILVLRLVLFGFLLGFFFRLFAGPVILRSIDSVHNEPWTLPRVSTPSIPAERLHSQVPRIFNEPHIAWTYEAYIFDVYVVRDEALLTFVVEPRHQLDATVFEECFGRGQDIGVAVENPDEFWLLKTSGKEESFAMFAAWAWFEGLLAELLVKLPVKFLALC